MKRHLNKQLPFANVTPYVVIAFMLLVVVLMCFSASYRIAVIAGVIASIAQGRGEGPRR